MTSKRRPRISLCLIARNEEAMLPGCLASVPEAVDEIVLVDTGSTDRTLDLARAAGARIVEQPWQGDFSLHRNEALRHATGDWVLVLDCDERLAPGAAAVLRAEVGVAGPPVGLLPLHDASRLDAAPEEVLSGRARLGEPCWLPRLLRRLPDLRYEDPLHENVDAFALRHGKKARLVRADIIHLGEIPELRQKRGKSQRNTDLLRRRCQQSPGDVTAWGHLAMELYKIGGADAEARAAAEEGWRRVAAYPRDRRILRLAMARVLVQLRAGDWAGALESARTAAARDGAHPDLAWAEGVARLRLAAPGAAERQASLAAAERAFREALAQRDAPQTDLCLRGTSSWRALVGLGHTLLLQGRAGEAARAFEEALRERPDVAEARLGLVGARLDAGDPAAALALAEPLLQEEPDGWVLAAAAARELGAEADARLLLARAGERSGRGFTLPGGRDRYEELRRVLGG